MTADASPSLTPPGRPVVVWSTILLAAYLIALHALIADGTRPRLTLAVVFVPWLVALGSALFAPQSGSLRRGIAAALLATCAWAAWHYADTLATHADLMLYVENVGFFSALSAVFASSLRPGSVPLITRMARVARNGDMPPSVMHYTRVITLAWAAFFAITSIASTVLFFTQSRATWSAFANLAIWPLVVAGFVIEYAIRLRVLREVRHTPLMTSVMAFQRRDAIDRSEPR